MSIFDRLQVALSKKNFQRQFHPLGLKKRRTLLVSVPSEPAQIMTTLSFLGGLKKWGQIIALIPHAVHQFYYWLPKKYYTTIVYENPGRYLGKEKKILRQQLQGHTIHFLVELNSLVNLSFPNLSVIEKRICFYDMKNYPYYNIMMKDGFSALHEFFDIKRANPAKVVSFSGHSKTKVRTAYGKRKPLCLVNGPLPPEWAGDTIVVGKDIPATHPDILCLLYFSEAYYGKRDILYEFACVFKKKIVDK